VLLLSCSTPHRYVKKTNYVVEGLICSHCLVATITKYLQLSIIGNIVIAIVIVIVIVIIIVTVAIYVVISLDMVIVVGCCGKVWEAVKATRHPVDTRCK
jgi:hypothetical protein